MGPKKHPYIDFFDTLVILSAFSYEFMSSYKKTKSKEFGRNEIEFGPETLVSWRSTHSSHNTKKSKSLSIFWKNGSTKGFANPYIHAPFFILAHEYIRTQYPIAQKWSSLLELPRGSSIYTWGAYSKMQTTKQLLMLRLLKFYIIAPEYVRSQYPIPQIWSSLLDLPRGSSIYTWRANTKAQTTKQILIVDIWHFITAPEYVSRQNPIA